MNHALGVGYVFKDVDGELFPMVGLRTQGEAVKVNFGHSPFKFDIESFVHQRRNETWKEIQSIDVNFLPTEGSFKAYPSEGTRSTTDAQSPQTAMKMQQRTKSAMDRAVLEYLSHHGYGGAARALRKAAESREVHTREILSSAILPTSSTSSPSGVGVAPFKEADMDDIDARQRIMSAVLSGDVDFALEETRKRYPAALEVHRGWILFRLRCRKFVELLLEAAAALKIAKKMEAHEPGVGPTMKGAVGARVGLVPSGRTRGMSMSMAPSIPPRVSEVVEGEQDTTPMSGNGVQMNTDSDAMEVDEVVLGPDGTASSAPIPLKSVNVHNSGIVSDGSQPSSMSQKAREKQPEHLGSSPPSFDQAPSSTDAAPSIEQPTTTSPAQVAFDHALRYGRTLHTDYVHDDRPDVQSLFKRTFSLVAYENPLEVVGEVSELAGQKAREELAAELNQYILSKFIYSYVPSSPV